MVALVFSRSGETGEMKRFKLRRVLDSKDGCEFFQEAGELKSLSSSKFEAN